MVGVGSWAAAEKRYLSNSLALSCEKERKKETLDKEWERSGKFLVSCSWSMKSGFCDLYPPVSTVIHPKRRIHRKDRIEYRKIGS